MPTAGPSIKAGAAGRLLAAFAAAVTLGFLAVAVLAGPEWAAPVATLARPATLLLIALGATGVAWLFERKAGVYALLRPFQVRPAPVLLAIYVVTLSTVAIRQHVLLESHLDLSIFENTLWNTLQGRPLYSSVLGRPFLGEHISPALLLIVPVYSLWQHPATLLVLQSAALAAGGLPIYWLAARRFGPFGGVALLCVYLVYPALHGVNLFDFHEIALAVPLLSFSFYFLETGRRGACLATLVLAGLCKEEVWLTAAALGAYAALVRREWRFGTILLATSSLVFVAEVRLLLPSLRGAPFPYVDRYAHFGTDLGEVVRTVLTRPDLVLESIAAPGKLRYLGQLLSPLAFLPLLGTPLMLALPTLGRNLLSNHWAQYDLTMHESAPMLPFLFFAAIDGADNLARWASRMVRARRQRRLALEMRLTGSTGSRTWRMGLPHDTRRLRTSAAALVCVSGLWLGQHPASRLLGLGESGQQATLRDMLSQIPPEASVSAHHSLVSHLARRQAIRVYPALEEPEFVLLRFYPLTGEYPLWAHDLRRHALGLLTSGDYGVAAARNGLLLLRRDQPLGPDDLARGMAEIALRHEAEHLPGSTGRRIRDDRASGGLARRAGPRDPPGALAIAASLLPPGWYRASYHLKVDGHPPGRHAALLDVNPERWESLGIWRLAETNVVTDGRTGGFRRIDLRFHNPEFAVLHFRVLVPAGAGVTVDRIEVQPMFPLTDFAALLADD